MAMTIGRLARGAAWTTAGLTGLVAALLLVLLAINWQDRPPSADALRLARLVDERVPVADADNAYVYLLGMSVPRAEDPARWGVRRRAWLDGLTPATPRPLVLPGVDAPHDARATRLPAACDAPTRACVEALHADATVLDAHLDAGAWRLARYEALLARTGWRESIPADLDAPLPSYTHALAAQKLFLLDAWRHARLGDAHAVRDRLDRDARFWRRVLARSDLLISRMIAAAALRRNFAYGSLALRELPSARVGDAIPAGWTHALTDDERSMLRAMAGEWRWTSSAMRRMARDARGSPKPGDRAGAPLFQLQDTINRSADFAVRFADASRAPYPRLKQALASTTRTSAVSAYNPVGAILAGIGPPAYTNYALRVADLEGLRRAALATARLRANGIAATDVPRALAELPAALSDPYTGRPLRWDARARAIGFAAQSGGPRASDERIWY